MTGEPSTVGIVGVGTMGSAMANALRHHHRLVVRDIDAAAAQRQRSNGATIVASPADAADQADLILLSLPGPDHVRAVVAGPDGLDRKSVV